MRKIYFILPSLNFGGGEKVIINIANNMNFNKYSVKIISLRIGNDLDSIINKNIEVIKFNKSRITFAFIELMKFLNHNKPDIIFSGAGEINIILGFFKNITFLKKIKIIGRERGVVSEIFEKDYFNFKKFFIKFLYKNFIKNLEILIVQSEIMKKEFEKYINIDKNKLKVFYNPLDLKLIDVKSEEKLPSDFKFSKINLISVGRLEDVKNHLKMLDIFNYIDKSNYVLNIVGSGRTEQKIKDKIEKLNLSKNVKMWGFSDNPYNFLKNSDVLLITSEREALPNVALEANACGCYVLALDCPGGIKEIIKNNENGNVLKNIEETAKALKKIDLNDNLKEKVIKFSEQYDVKYYIERLEKIL